MFIENSDGYLKCEVPATNASLISNIIWYKNGAVLNLNIDGLTASNATYPNQILNFKSISLSQSGQYFCLVQLKDNLNIESAKYNLRVYQGLNFIQLKNLFN